MYAHLTSRKLSEVTKPNFTCLKSAMETPEQCVKYIQTSEGYLEPS